MIEFFTCGLWIECCVNVHPGCLYAIVGNDLLGADICYAVWVIDPQMALQTVGSTVRI